MQHSPIDIASAPLQEQPTAGVFGKLLQLGLRWLLVLIAANALFLGIRFADNLVPKETVRAGLTAGYANGAMTTDSYPNNMLIGWDQGSDCIAGQLAVLGGVDPTHDAIAPRVLTLPQVGTDLRAPHAEVCLDLKRYLDGKIPTIPDITYTRFWQGGASFLAFALTIMPVDGYRALLLDLTLGLITLTGVLAALAGRPLLTALAPLLVISFLFDGQIGYAQLLSHGPAHVAFWLFAVLMIAQRDRLTHDRLLLVAVAAGATEAFLDQIISVPLIAGNFLIVAGIVLDARSPSRSVGQTALAMATLAAAWGLGFAGSYAIKLLLSIALLGSGPFHDFANQLTYRMGTLDPELGLTAQAHPSRLAMLVRNLRSLASNAWHLGYGGESNHAVATVLTVLLSLLGWLGAVSKWATSGTRQRGFVLAAGLPYIAAAVMLLAWIIAMPEHTLRHAFMVRSSILLLIGGWGWLHAASAITRRDEHPA